ncbi:unnamed protein product [Merluccius merluccius]
MSGFLRVLLGRRPGPGPGADLVLVRRAGEAMRHRADRVARRPPGDGVGVAESVGVMVLILVSILGPSAWIMSDIRNSRRS